jgi:hypothetical protein
LGRLSDQRTILVVGQTGFCSIKYSCIKTGSGKTTTLNSLVNYIYKVQINELFRLKLVQETLKKPFSELPYHLTVIDEPGFEDTKELDQDKVIIQYIKPLFTHDFETLDTVCFVIKAADNRFTDSQKCVFNYVLDLFGQNISKNVFFWMIFDDASKPPVEDAIIAAGMSNTKMFKLNNSAFMELWDNTLPPQEKQFKVMFWNMERFSFDAFFKIPTLTKSISLSRKMLQEILHKVNDLSTNLKQALQFSKELKNAEIDVTNDSQTINTNSFYEIKTTEYKSPKRPSNSNIITTCGICANKTCHLRCCVSNKKEQYNEPQSQKSFAESLILNFKIGRYENSSL